MGIQHLSKQAFSTHFELAPNDNRRLANVCGQYDENLRKIEESLNVEINNRGHTFDVIGKTSSVQKATNIIKQLFKDTSTKSESMKKKLNLMLQTVNNHFDESDQPSEKRQSIKTANVLVKARSPNQSKYLNNILNYDINFSVGPAGTGKTYLAVACAVQALEREQVQRIVLVRPAVEAGERLGFLPGDMVAKVDPYLRPLYDALFEMIGIELVGKLIAKNVIEVAPLAFMRGRTLNDAFIILDEAQNCTIEQMKMFLTRIGFDSKVVVTGDITQIDLPKRTKSGLRHALDILKDISDIRFNFFEARDVVRHPLVQKIVQAYDKE